jgi:hypothetical protein
MDFDEYTLKEIKDLIYVDLIGPRFPEKWAKFLRVRKEIKDER